MTATTHTTAHHSLACAIATHHMILLHKVLLESDYIVHNLQTTLEPHASLYKYPLVFIITVCTSYNTCKVGETKISTKFNHVISKLVYTTLSRIAHLGTHLFL